MPDLFHVSSVRNRESINRFGLDWSRMGSVPGIAGSPTPEVEGCFLAIGDYECEWFVQMNNTGGPVDVWRVDGIDTATLKISMQGYQYFPDAIAAAHLTLVRADVMPTSPS